MKGAAVGYTCGLRDVPFVIIRGISDVARETPHTNFKENLHTVCQNSYQILEEFVPLFRAL
jgi:nucleoside phosphorylase